MHLGGRAPAVRHLPGPCSPAPRRCSSLDEPFSALDALTRRKLKERLKSPLKQELRIPMIHVTHDIREALFPGQMISCPLVQGRVAHKWILQFMLIASEIEPLPGPPGRDRQRRRGGARDVRHRQG